VESEEAVPGMGLKGKPVQFRRGPAAVTGDEARLGRPGD